MYIYYNEYKLATLLVVIFSILALLCVYKMLASFASSTFSFAFLWFVLTLLSGIGAIFFNEQRNPHDM
jgi:hypothetical protein